MNLSLNDEHKDQEKLRKLW